MSAPRRPGDMIDPIKARLPEARVAEFLFKHHRGYARRTKLKDIAAALLGIVPGHGDRVEVALREVISDMVGQIPPYPIASESGPTGGVWWIADEHERAGALAGLDAQVRGLMKRRRGLEAASLEYQGPRQGSLV